VYRGVSTDGPITNVKVVGYTTNNNTYYRFRVRDTTNNTIICTSTQSNTKVFPNVAIVDLGTISNLPSTQSLLTIEMLATDATGNTGVMGRQSIGIHTLQVYP